MIDLSRQSDKQTIPDTCIMNSGPYRYTDLDGESHQIRLLNLLPSTDTNSQIFCPLAKALIGERPKYEALSYCWGAKDDNCEHPIYLDGHATIVSTNLEAALRALRLLTISRTLWIDAICINQNDMAEKAVQVTMMGTIYSKAKRAIVWLGSQSEDSTLAMTSLRNLTFEKSLEQLALSAHDAITSPINRPFSWFSCVWVVQEFSLAKAVLFTCGPDSFEWSGLEKLFGKFLRAQNNINNERRESKLASEKIYLFPQGDVWTRLFMAKRGVFVPGFGSFRVDKSIHALLEAHIALNVTNPRDRISGFLGMFANPGLVIDVPGMIKKIGRPLGLSSQPPPPPTVDYTRLTSEVLIDWAKWIIESEKSLKILFTCQMTTTEGDLPS